MEARQYSTPAVENDEKRGYEEGSTTNSLDDRIIMNSGPVISFVLGGVSIIAPSRWMLLLMPLAIIVLLFTLSRGEGSRLKLNKHSRKQRARLRFEELTEIRHRNILSAAILVGGSLVALLLAAFLPPFLAGIVSTVSINLDEAFWSLVWNFGIGVLLTGFFISFLLYHGGRRGTNLTWLIGLVGTLCVILGFAQAHVMEQDDEGRCSEYGMDHESFEQVCPDN